MHIAELAKSAIGHACEEHTSPCARTRRYRAPHNRSEPFGPRQFSLNCIINMLGFNFRHGHRLAREQ